MEIYTMVFSPIRVNTYIVADDSGDCAIIDCGCYDYMEFKELETFLKDKILNPVLLLNTHCHLDHIFGNGFILERYGLRTFSSEYDEINRKSSVQHARLFGLSMNEPPDPAGFIVDNQIITFGSLEFEVLHVPGHSPGGLAFYNRKNSILFTGDTLFEGSIGRTDLLGGSYEALIQSITNKLFILPPETTAYPGHGNKTTIEREMNYNPFFT